MPDRLEWHPECHGNGAQVGADKTTVQRVYQNSHFKVDPEEMGYTPDENDLADNWVQSQRLQWSEEFEGFHYCIEVADQNMDMDTEKVETGLTLGVTFTSPEDTMKARETLLNENPEMVFMSDHIPLTLLCGYDGETCFGPSEEKDMEPDFIVLKNEDGDWTGPENSSSTFYPQALESGDLIDIVCKPDPVGNMVDMKIVSSREGKETMHFQWKVEMDCTEEVYAVVEISDTGACNMVKFAQTDIEVEDFNEQTAEELGEQDKAAKALISTKLSAAWKGKQARKEFAQKKQQKFEADQAALQKNMNKRATVLQAYFRGKADRIKVQNMQKCEVVDEAVPLEAGFKITIAGDVPEKPVEQEKLKGAVQRRIAKSLGASPSKVRILELYNFKSNTCLTFAVVEPPGKVLTQKGLETALKEGTEGSKTALELISMEPVYSKKQADAITKIQASRRGQQARKTVADMRARGIQETSTSGQAGKTVVQLKKAFIKENNLTEVAELAGDLAKKANEKYGFVEVDDEWLKANAERAGLDAKGERAAVKLNVKEEGEPEEQTYMLAQLRKSYAGAMLEDAEKARKQAEAAIVGKKTKAWDARKQELEKDYKLVQLRNSFVTSHGLVDGLGPIAPEQVSIDGVEEQDGYMLRHVRTSFFEKAGLAAELIKGEKQDVTYAGGDGTKTAQHEVYLQAAPKPKDEARKKLAFEDDPAPPAGGGAGAPASELEQLRAELAELKGRMSAAESKASLFARENEDLKGRLEKLPGSAAYERLHNPADVKLDPKHFGKHLMLSNGNATATRTVPCLSNESERFGVITSAPLQNREFFVRVDRVIRHKEGLGIGVTMVEPAKAALSDTPTEKLPTLWAVGWDGIALWKLPDQTKPAADGKGPVAVRAPASLEYQELFPQWKPCALKAGETLRCFVDPTGALVVHVGGREIRGPKGVPKDAVLYGVVDLYGSCESVSIVGKPEHEQAQRPPVKIDMQNAPSVIGATMQPLAEHAWWADPQKFARSRLTLQSLQGKWLNKEDDVHRHYIVAENGTGFVTLVKKAGPASDSFRLALEDARKHVVKLVKRAGSTVAKDAKKRAYDDGLVEYSESKTTITFKKAGEVWVRSGAPPEPAPPDGAKELYPGRDATGNRVKTDHPLTNEQRAKLQSGGHAWQMEETPQQRRQRQERLGIRTDGPPLPWSRGFEKAYKDALIMDHKVVEGATWIFYDKPRPSPKKKPLPTDFESTKSQIENANNSPKKP